MESMRGPLVDQSNGASSRLPMQGSRLQKPGSRLPMPGSRLPKPGSGLPTKAPVQTKRKSSSISADDSAVSNKRPKLQTSTSGSNLRSMMGTAPKVKPVLSKPAPVKTVPAPSARPGMTRKASASSLPPKPTSSAAKPSAVKGGAAATQAKKGAGGAKPKRAAWDLKGRLQDMEELMAKNSAHHTNLQEKMDSNNSRIAHLEKEKQILKGTVQKKEAETSEASQTIARLKQELSESRAEVIETSRRLKQQVEDLEFSKQTLTRQKTSLEGDLTAKCQEVSGLKSTVGSLTAAQEGIKAELVQTKLSLEQALEDGRLKASVITSLKNTIADQETTIKDFEMKAREHETERRKLHNTVQELKGNIRVFCRVRPLLGEECLGNDGVVQHMTFPDEDQKVLEVEKLADVAPNETLAGIRKGSNNSYEFKFDKVFQPGSAQSDVFDEISQLVQSALDGYNVCIFAYGQTGSGKTFTMEGPPDKRNVDARGMIPRTVEQIFESASELEAKGWTYNFIASYLEIYNETVRDLLGSGKDDEKHDIKMVASGSSDTYVTNLSSTEVKRQDQVHHLLKKASENRAVAETKCNERSSRSHSVFRLKLSGHNKFTDETSVGLLNLIDLAGSERLKDSGSQGARLKETQCINKSLSNLGNVIMALANKDPHIPYRNSKLTHYLQSSLGGNSKCLMFVNVSPREEHFSETLNSLRFATKVNNCSIGTATKKSK